MGFDRNIKKENILPAVTPPRKGYISTSKRKKPQETWNLDATAVAWALDLGTTDWNSQSWAHTPWIPRAVQLFLLQHHAKAALGLQILGSSLLTPGASVVVLKPTAANQLAIFWELSSPRAANPLLASVPCPSVWMTVAGMVKASTVMRKRPCKPWTTALLTTWKRCECWNERTWNWRVKSRKCVTKSCQSDVLITCPTTPPLRSSSGR